MTSMKRNTVSFPDDIVASIEAIRALPEFSGESFSKIVVFLIRRGLDAEREKSGSDE